jgi:hypothetical protein
MKRTALNLLIDALAALFFLGMIATGYVLRFPLPPGTNKSLSLWGLSRHQWGGVHFWISLGLLAVLLTHLALHWQWVVTVVGRQLRLATNPQGRHLRSGVISLLAIAAAMGLFAWVAEVSVGERDEPCCPPGETTGTPDPGTPTAGETHAAGENGKVSFWKDVYPVLEASCLACHGPSKARAGFRIDRREDYFRTDHGNPLVVPGDSAASPLTAILSGARKDIPMLDRHRLPDKQLTVVKGWIDARCPLARPPRREVASLGSRATKTPCASWVGQAQE